MNTNLLSTSSITSDSVKNAQGEDLGKIEDMMVNMESGEIEYVVVSFGGFLGIGDKYFAVPFSQLNADFADKCMVLNVDKERLKDAPGFDKDNWPNFADQSFRSSISDYYS
ncbi:MAG: PRC-barrel domain-containing protein [Alphaproteobacteria bacterium]|jgi:sporulation protein YlmC with PRC-barrel domain